MLTVQPTIGQRVVLAGDGSPHLGSIVVDDVREGRVLGTFTPGPDFGSIEPLVREYEEIINDQIFSLLDEFGAKLAALRLELVSADGQVIGSVNDLQIASDGGTLVRLGVPAPHNGAVVHTATSRTR
jgi:hypothetical protein